MVSIIIPAYNQYHSLVIVLNAFCMQKGSMDDVEFIIVDDGSTDTLSKVSYIDCLEETYLNYKIVHQRNCGRAAARNAGIKNSKGDLLIFCDADRFPGLDFIQQHLTFHRRGDSIVIGSPYDYFGKNLYVDEKSINWDMVKRFSRIPEYFKAVEGLYNEAGYSSFSTVWLSFLVGNASVKREVLEMGGYFDEEFKEWGFEHFELAYRLWCKGYKFSLNKQAMNFHIPHPRMKNFYNEAIEKSATIMCEKHPKINKDTLVCFVKGKIDVMSAEKDIYVGENNDG